MEKASSVPGADSSPSLVLSEEESSTSECSQHVSTSWSQFLAKPSTPRSGRPHFAWQSTEKTLTRAALVPSGLVDDVLVVSALPFHITEQELEADAGASSPLAREPVVLERLPPASKAGRGSLTDGMSAGSSTMAAPVRPEPPQRVEWFCFPSGFAQALWQIGRPPDRSHIFALFADGAPLRGVVLTTYYAAEVSDQQNQQQNHTVETVNDGRQKRKKRLWVPVAVCMLTRLAIVPALCAWVEQLSVVLENGSFVEKLFACAAQLADEVPRPVAGVLGLKVAGPANEVVHVREHFAASRGNQARSRSVSLFDETLARPTGGGGSIWLAAMLLGPQGLVKALACALLERPLLFVADDTALLAPVAEALLALIRPFEWAHVYVPVLPRPLLELLDAPQPFLLGILRSWLPEDFAAQSKIRKSTHAAQAEAQREQHLLPMKPHRSRGSSRFMSSSSKRRAEAAAATTEESSSRRRSTRPRGHSAIAAEAASALFWQNNPMAPGTVVFDLDTGDFFSPDGSTVDDDLNSFPEDFADAVRAATRAIQHAAVDSFEENRVQQLHRPKGADHPSTAALLSAEAALQAACANQMRRLLDGCASFLGDDDDDDDRKTSNSDENASLRAKEFVEAHPVPHHRPFLRRLVETQHFWQFVDLTREIISENKRSRPDASDKTSPSRHRPTSLSALKAQRSDSDAYCYTVPPPLPQERDSVKHENAADEMRMKERRRRRRAVPYEDRTYQVTHEWYLESLFGIDREPAVTRVYRYGLLADLLCVPFDELWAQLSR